MSSKYTDIDRLSINTLKLLSVDQVAKAKSGHPGAPLGLAPAAHVLWKQIHINPKNPTWINRDRFVLSNGHACALLYSLLHLSGFDYSIEDLKQFRQIDSKTPGHPEYELPGVEVTTGPLGQGIADAVGIAIAQANFAATYNKPSENLILCDSFTYVFLGDGCLQEGVSSEACSLAGHLQLGNLIVIYDDNSVTIDGSTSLSFTEDVVKRFEAYGWQTIVIDDGNNDLDGIDAAIKAAKSCKERPTLIKLKTIIGVGSLVAGTATAHGTPLQDEDVKQLKRHLGFSSDESFVVPQKVYDYYQRTLVDPNIELNNQWDKIFETYKTKFPELGKEIERRLNGKLPENWDSVLPTFSPEDGTIPTRKLSEKVLEHIYPVLPELIGGSADLTPSTLARWKEAVDFQPESSGLGDYSGRYLRYGVREHAMGAIMNGISAFGANYKPYGGTFLNFVSYGIGALRLAALSEHPVIWIATHDSIGLGEDGPTHQPIESLTLLRAMPNLHVWRPADGNETSAAFKSAINSTKTPSVIALSRQPLPQLQGSSIEKASMGGYIIYEEADPHLILVSSGSEVSLCIDTAEALAKEFVNVRVVSMPDFFTFNHQSREYRLSVFPDNVPILSVEAGATLGWGKYSHEQFGIDRYGCSGKGPDVFKYMDMIPSGVLRRSKEVIEFYKGKKLYSPINKVLSI